jgi:hypothetical protein
MLREIWALQARLGMSDGEMLFLARYVAGTTNAYDCAQIRCLEDLLLVEQAELLEEMLRMPDIRRPPVHAPCMVR